MIWLFATKRVIGISKYVEGHSALEIVESLRSDLLIKLNELIKTYWKLLDIPPASAIYFDALLPHL